MSENDPPPVPVPDYRPVERFWPYVDLPEQPTEEELARLNPELAEALFGLRPITAGEVLDFRFTVVAAYVDGRSLDLSDRHKRLYERYRNRPKREIK